MIMNNNNNQIKTKLKKIINLKIDCIKLLKVLKKSKII